MLDDFFYNRLYIVLSAKDVPRLEELNDYIGGAVFPSGQTVTESFMKHLLKTHDEVAIVYDGDHIYYSSSAYKENKRVYLKEFLPKIKVDFSEKDYCSLFE